MLKKSTKKLCQNVTSGEGWQFAATSKLFCGKALYLLLILFLSIALFAGLIFTVGGGSNGFLSDKPQNVSNAASSTPANTSGTWITNGRQANGFAGGSGTADDPYQIATAAQLAYLSYMIYNDLAPVQKVTETDKDSNGQVEERRTYYYNYLNTYFELTNSINLVSFYWQPIGRVTDTGTTDVPNYHYRYFAGHFDGNDYSVIGIYTKSAMGQGLFGAVGTKSDGSAATISNLHVSGNILGLEQTAGVIGRADHVDITNCSNAASISSDENYIGGIVGRCEGTVNITNCWNLGTVNGGSYTGGIAGYGPGSSIYIKNCYNKVAISGGGHVGGIVGWGGQVSDCYNSGRISANSGTTGGTGGIVGGGTIVLIQRCYNDGNISSLDHVGGILGYSSLTTGQRVNVYDCYNTGTINGRNAIGGITGEIRYWAGANITITRCYNAGSISGSSQVGGISGLIYKYGGSATISNCINIGSVTGSNRGGIVGDRTGSSLLGKITYTNNQYSQNIGAVDGGSASGCTYVSTLADDIKTQEYFTTNYSTWDFGSVWQFVADENNGYPIFQYQSQQYSIHFNAAGGNVNYADVSAIRYPVAAYANGNYTYTGGGLNFTYDLDTHILTINGTATGAASFPSSQNMELRAGDKYDVLMQYISGSTSGSSDCLVIEAVKNWDALSTRNHTDYGFISSGSAVNTIEISELAEAEGDALKGWYWFNGVKRTFSNYKIKYQVVKQNDTAWMKTFVVDDTVGGVSTPFRDGYIFTGYYSQPNGEGTQYFDETGACVLQPEDDIVLYAAWEDNTWLAHAADSFAGGSGSQSSPYLIETAEQLALLSYNVYNGVGAQDEYVYVDTYFKQIADIDLSTYPWVPIGVYCNLDGVLTDFNFAGNFDGGGYTISGIELVEVTGEAYNRRGLFGRVNGEIGGGEIKNINITNSNITGGSYVGGIIGYAGAFVRLENCKTDASVTGTGEYVGGMVGSFDGYIITECVSQGNVNGVGVVGGLVGTSTAQILDCVNKATINASWRVGGIVGVTAAGVYDCSNYGYISTTGGSVGGIAGNSTNMIANCFNYAQIAGTAQDVAGIVGITQASVANCFNLGKITSRNNGTTAGIVGTVNLYSSQSVTNCHNVGNLSGGNGTGGIIGILCIYQSNVTFVLSKCANSGDIIGGPATGGVIGFIDSISGTSGYSYTVQYCLNQADITSSTATPYTVGGIVGGLNAANGTGVFKYNYTRGTFSAQGSDGNIGGMIGRPYVNLSANSNIYFEYCAAVFNTSGSAANIGQFWSGWNGNQVVVRNSYAILNGNVTLSSGITDMDGNFGYHSNFHDGVPIPLGIYAITEFFTQTGIQSYLQNNF